MQSDMVFELVQATQSAYEFLGDVAHAESNRSVIKARSVNFFTI